MVINLFLYLHNVQVLLADNPWTGIDGKVVFATGGAGSLVSVQVQALVQLGANACIIGRNVAKTERVAAELSATRPGAKVLGFGAVDVRKPQDLEKAVARCVQALGSIDFVMYVLAINVDQTSTLAERKPD